MKLFDKAWGGLIKVAFRTIMQLFAAKIKNEKILAVVQTTIIPAEQMVDALSDEDPDNDAQILAIVRRYTNAQLLPKVEATYEEYEARIGDEKLRKVADVASQYVFTMGAIYTDENPDNDAQFRTYTEQFLEDPENQRVLLQEVAFKVIRKYLGNQAYLVDIAEAAVMQKLSETNIDIDGDGE